MTYQQIISQLEAGPRARMSLGLDPVIALLDRLGNPHHGLRGALVAGTNGKGSVCATLDSISRAAGRSTVLLVKPHLRTWTERIVIGGQTISEACFVELAREVLAAAQGLPAPVQPTTFDVVTSMGFLAAREHEAESVICEVGLGGRLDSTNVADLGFAVITNIALDHTEYLGTTEEQIAREKAAVIKPGNGAVTAARGPGLDVIRSHARGNHASLAILHRGERYRGLDVDPSNGVGVEVGFPDGTPLEVFSPLRGGFQEENLALAVVAARLMGFDRDAIVRGAATTRWPGRMEFVEGTPPFLLDGAHNPPAMRALRLALRTRARGHRTVGGERANPFAVPRRRRFAIFGAMRDKQLPEMIAELQKMAPRIITTQVDSSRAADAGLLAEMGGGTPTATPAEAIGLAQEIAGARDLVVVCGSLALVGAARAEIARFRRLE